MTHGMTSAEARLLSRLQRQLQHGGAHCEVLACCLADPGMRAVFARIAEVKDALGACLATLSPSQALAVGADATPPSAHPSHRVYAHWLSRSRDAGRLAIDMHEVVELERAEDRLLQQFDSVLQGPHSAVVREGLKRYLPQIQFCHAELRQLFAAPDANESRPRNGGFRRNRPNMDQQSRRFS